jgi:hypothetical protein
VNLHLIASLDGIEEVGASSAGLGDRIDAQLALSLHLSPRNWNDRRDGDAKRPLQPKSVSLRSVEPRFGSQLHGLLLLPQDGYLPETKPDWECGDLGLS